ncbi:hypothetical protein [Bacteroides caecimuris]|uniref:hypothetical protein n=1 Tax=Bacteroides caecimuris TaxID=1796613 RepID=UPI0026E003F9|nr:hypothetical protein [Bacteroides caecimuris]
MSGEKLITKFEEEPPKTEEYLQMYKKAYISLSISELNQKWGVQRVRANVCPHSAIILALIAESTMNKGIERKYESMRAKMKKNFYGENYKSFSSRGGILN